jgi:tripartite-type tricarboxylate transporter receptor subunit TctC
MAASLAGAAWIRPASAQARYPARPVTIVVPFSPGGIADLTARAVAQAMAGTLNQAFVVDNKPSAGGIVATASVTNAAPDGYTLLLSSNANAVSASLFKKLPFDVTRDLASISTLGFFDLVLCVNAGTRFMALRDLLAYAKAQPGKLIIGTISIGSTQHLAAELFKTRAGIDALVVPYKGSPAVLGALRSGEIDLAFEILGPTLGQISAGAARALAVTSAQRNPALPGAPTVQEAGVSGYDVASWNALSAPAGTPADVIAVLQRAAAEAIASAAVQQRLQALGVRAQAGTPAQLDALLAAEIQRWRDVIRAAKIEPQ